LARINTWVGGDVGGSPESLGKSEQIQAGASSENQRYYLRSKELRCSGVFLTRPSTNGRQPLYEAGMENANEAA